MSNVVGAELAAATLVCLPDMTPRRLRKLFDHFGDARRALTAVRSGRAAAAFIADTETGRPEVGAAELARQWRGHADSGWVARRIQQRGTAVWLEGTPEYPVADDVPGRPPVLLAEGSRPDALTQPRVAVVGTRGATPHGLADAHELGAFLAMAGITVVSGMAIGIDGAAHDGVLGAGGTAVGVVATGLDIEYPRRHVALYERVRRAGVVLSETGFGVRPAPGRFPVRNRIIAALADVVVVVEATIKGGARITAQFALDYGRTVLAVPGSRRNRAAEGTNALIADGAHPLLDWDDVLVALGLSSTSGGSLRAPVRPAPSTDGSAVLRALGGEPATNDQLTSRTDLDATQVAVAIVALERSGWVTRAQGEVWPR